MPAPAPKVRKPRRWLRRFALLTLLLLVGVWLAPNIAARSGLPNRIVRDATSDMRGTVEIGSASLGWFSPIELRDVVAKDAQGRVLLTAPRITSTRSLLALLTNRADLGAFTLHQPVAEVRFENGATNVEDAIANYLKDDSTPTSSRPAVSVHVTDGTLVLHDGDKHTQIESLDVEIGVPSSKAEPITVAMRSASPGSLDATLSLAEKSNVNVTAAAFPLEAISPVFKRLDPSINVSGILTAKLEAGWSKDAAMVECTASIRNFDLVAAALKGDRLRLASVELPLKAELTGHHLKLERAELKCDIGTFTASGSFDPDEEVDKVFEKHGVRVEGNLDLAKMAATLPRLMHVREGTAIREGNLIVKLSSRAAENGTTWDGEVRTSALKAERGGKTIEWTEPLAVEFSGRVPAGQLPTFDKFICRSDFIAINAKGSPESFRAAANVYLDRLATRLGEFVDLRGTTLAGEGSAWVVASRTPQGDFKVETGIELKQFAFSDGARRGLQEQALSVKLSSAGNWPKGGAIRVDSGSLTVAAAADSAELKLLEPIPDARKPAAGTLSAKVNGDLGRWMSRVRGFVRVPNYTFGGQTLANGTLRFAEGTLAIDKLSVGIDQAVFRGAGLNLNEPRIDASANLSVKKTAVEFANFQIRSPVLAVADGKLTIETPADGNTAVSGGGNAATDLERLGRTVKISNDPKGSDSFHGQGAGPIRFRWQGDTTNFGGTLDVKDFTYGDPKASGISEPTLKLDLDAQYDQSLDRLTFHHAKADRPGLAIDGKGTFAKFDTSQDVNLNGTLVYDLAKLSPDLRQSFGGNLQAVGTGTRPFSLSGSLGGPKPNVFAKLNADAGIGWDSVKAYGFEMGRGEFTVKLVHGKADISPIHATFGEGKIWLSPSARFDPEPAEFSCAKGKIVDRTKLTPAVTAGALGYALPAIANAAQATGEISAILDDNRIPLADVTRARIKGQLVIHKAVVGPGPVITAILQATGSTSTTMTLANELTVPVRVENGRVHHENFAITVNNYTIRTFGSVGFDGTLAMVAEVPIPGTLPALKNNPVLKKALEGKIVKVPLSGTVSKPTLDPNFFPTAVASLARDAMKGIGKDLLNKELEKLFPIVPKK